MHSRGEVPYWSHGLTHTQRRRRGGGGCAQSWSHGCASAWSAIARARDTDALGAVHAQCAYPPVPAWGPRARDTLTCPHSVVRTRAYLLPACTPHGHSVPMRLHAMHALGRPPPATLSRYTARCEKSNRAAQRSRRSIRESLHYSEGRHARGTRHTQPTSTRTSLLAHIGYSDALSAQAKFITGAVSA